MDYLISKGISADRLSFAGKGELDPVATNETPEGRAENRRVEFNIISR
jgi:outer membrane protein OmpA-like peptidoglycan-associated protein